IVAYGGFFARLHRSAESECSSSKLIEDSDAKFRHLFDISPFPAMVTSLISQKVLAVNERTANRLGIPRVDAAGLHAPDFYMDPQQHEVMAEQLRTKGESEGLLRLRTPSGEQFWADVHARPITFDGEAAVLSVFHDVTGRVTAEQALRSNERRLADEN